MSKANGAPFLIQLSFLLHDLKGIYEPLFMQRLLWMHLLFLCDNRRSRLLDQRPTTSSHLSTRLSFQILDQEAFRQIKGSFCGVSFDAPCSFNFTFRSDKAIKTFLIPQFWSTRRLGELVILQSWREKVVMKTGNPKKDGGELVWRVNMTSRCQSVVLVS